MDIRRWLPFLIANIVISVISVLLVLWVAGSRSQPTVVVVTTTPNPLDAAANNNAQPNNVAAPTANPTSRGDVQTYTVQSGDMISSIAEANGLTIEEVIAANPQLPNPDSLEVGQQIFIPGAAPANLPTQSLATAGSNPTVAPIATVAVAVANGPAVLAIRAVNGVGDIANEQVLITNVGKEAVDLNGWLLQTPSGAEYRFPALRLFPGGQIAIYSGIGSDSVTNFYWNQPSAMWSNGQVVALLSPDGAIHTTYGIP